MPEYKLRAASPKGGAARPPGTDGIWTFVFIDMIVFSLFFMVYLSERLRLPDVFTASQAHLDPTFGLVNALILLTSSLFVAEAVAAARLDRPALVKTRLALALACGALFAASKLTEYSGKFAAGITPVALYQAASAFGECRKVRNCAAAFGCFDQLVMKADEDWVVS